VGRGEIPRHEWRRGRSGGLDPKGKYAISLKVGRPRRQRAHPSEMTTARRIERGSVQGVEGKGPEESDGAKERGKRLLKNIRGKITKRISMSGLIKEGLYET